MGDAQFDERLLPLLPSVPRLPLQSPQAPQPQIPTSQIPSPPVGSRGAQLLQRSRVVDRVCKVPGCTEKLVDSVSAATSTPSSRYNWRLRVCEPHRKAFEVQWPGQPPKRWCQVRATLKPYHQRARP
jgi:hypothetical protein